jgi:hypothetical protein
MAERQNIKELLYEIAKEELPDGIYVPPPSEMTLRGVDSDSDVETDLIDLFNDGVEIQQDAITLDLTGSAVEDVTTDADGNVTATITDTDTHVALQAGDGTVILGDPDGLRAGTNLALTDNNDGTATLDATARGFTTSDKQAMTTHPVALTELADGDYVDLPVRVPTGKTIEVWKWGARTDAQTTPAGLTVGLYDYDAAAYVASANTGHATGNPLASHDGAGDLALRLENTTGGTVNAGADFSATIE